MRTVRSLFVLLAVAAITVACSSNPSSGAASEPPAGGEPSVAAGQSEVAAASQPTGNDIGGAPPSLADGKWTGGHGKTTTSGAVSWTTDADLSTDVSSTQDSETQLAYNTDDTFVTININALGAPFQVAVTAPDWDASSDDCEVTYARADETGIDATFHCRVNEFIYMGVGTEPTGQIAIDGSFTATR